MFCKNCGTELMEKSDFCPECGLKVENLHINRKIGVPNSKVLLVFALVIIAAIITVIFVKTNDINSSPEKVAVATVKSEYEVDIKTMMKCFPDFTIREIAADEGLPANASLNQVVKAIEENYRYETPQTVKIINAELVGEYDISQYTIFRELYDYMTDEDFEAITAVAKVNVTFSVNGSEDSIQITCIEMKGKWYYLRTF